MRYFVVHFGDRETAPDSIEQIAAGLGVTSEQLVKRFIAEGLAAIDPKAAEAVPGANLEDFLVRNEVLRPRSDDEPAG